MLLDKFLRLANTLKLSDEFLYHWLLYGTPSELNKVIVSID